MSQSFGFKEAAELLERAWKFGGEINSEHGFLFALRYGRIRLDEIEDAIAKLALLPSAEEPICSEELGHFRRFVASAWPILLYWGGKKREGLIDVANARHSEVDQQLRRELMRILGRHSF
jgi:hypothetical protein